MTFECLIVTYKSRLTNFKTNGDDMSITTYQNCVVTEARFVLPAS